MLLLVSLCFNFKVCNRLLLVVLLTLLWEWACTKGSCACETDFLCQWLVSIVTSCLQFWAFLRSALLCSLRMIKNKHTHCFSSFVTWNGVLMGGRNAASKAWGLMFWRQHWHFVGLPAEETHTDCAKFNLKIALSKENDAAFISLFLHALILIVCVRLLRCVQLKWMTLELEYG